MKYFFIVGEPSGDMHAANCIKHLKQLDTNYTIQYTGGKLMEEEIGIAPIIDIKNMAFMGFVDVLKNITTIKRNFKIVKKALLKFKPDVLILVDYPGFNLRMAKWANKHNITTDMYISPTVWAWKEKRVETIKKYIRNMYVILPFEEAFYQKHNYKVHFVGHPLVDVINEKKQNLKSFEHFKQENNLSNAPIIAILPGSRVQEINYMLPTMLTVAKKFPDIQFVIAASNSIPESFYQNNNCKNVKTVHNQTYELLHYASAGLIKSGTSTLESALFNLPQIICYAGGNLSIRIAKFFVKLNYIGLPNLIMNKPIVKEFVQHDFNVENISNELTKILTNENYKKTILTNYAELKKMLAGGAGEKVAKYITQVN
ncbi:MAG: lipid-A-disaccharide synthase [Bacteroidetes bacterium]|nr:lipid-A-disaccharide synthase [Bacteroidota bacterium]